MLALGGAGRFGLPAAKLLAESEIVTRIAIAGRRPDVCEAAARHLGRKAFAVSVDAGDGDRVASLLRDFDILVNTAGSPTKLQLPLMRAAVEMDTHYCDLNSRVPPEWLGAAAEERGVTIIHGAGFACGLTNLLGKHAAGKLDRAEDLVGGEFMPRFLDLYPEVFNQVPHLRDLPPRGPRATELTWALSSRGSRGERLQVIRDALLVEYWLKYLPLLQGDANVSAYRNGRIVRFDPRLAALEIACAGDRTCAVAAISLSRRLSDFPDLCAVNLVPLWFSGCADAFDRLVASQAARLAVGETSLESAAASVYRAMENDLEQFLLDVDTARSVPAIFFAATGRLGDRWARSSVWLERDLLTGRNWLLLTGATLACTALGVLRGDIAKRGVFKLEDAVDLHSLASEVSRLLPELPSTGRLFEERLDMSPRWGRVQTASP